MKHIKCEDIIRSLTQTIDSALKRVDPAIEALLASACERESVPAAKWALDQVVQNAAVARKTDSYPCQDTGLSVFFVEIGREVVLDGLLSDAINTAVREGYREARKSVADPLTRLNTGDNTPAIIYTDIVEGENLKISFLAKGAGSENMSKLFMLTPSKGREGIINAVIDTVRAAGSNPCPPIVIGVGIGGDFEKSAMLAKKALLRSAGEYSPREDVRSLEAEILKRVNELGIGAAGLGGQATALWVAAETHPTHIGMLPVAVNIQCHSVRHGTLVL